MVNQVFFFQAVTSRWRWTVATAVAAMSNRDRGPDNSGGVRHSGGAGGGGGDWLWPRPCAPALRPRSMAGRHGTGHAYRSTTGRWTGGQVASGTCAAKAPSGWECSRTDWRNRWNCPQQPRPWPPLPARSGSAGSRRPPYRVSCPVAGTRTSRSVWCCRTSRSTRAFTPRSLRPPCTGCSATSRQKKTTYSRATTYITSSTWSSSRPHLQVSRRLPIQLSHQFSGSSGLTDKIGRQTSRIMNSDVSRKQILPLFFFLIFGDLWLYCLIAIVLMVHVKITSSLNRNRRSFPFMLLPWLLSQHVRQLTIMNEGNMFYDLQHCPFHKMSDVILLFSV